MDNEVCYGDLVVPSKRMILKEQYLGQRRPSTVVRLLNYAGVSALLSPSVEHLRALSSYNGI